MNDGYEGAKMRIMGRRQMRIAEIRDMERWAKEARTRYGDSIREEEERGQRTHEENWQNAIRRNELNGQLQKEIQDWNEANDTKSECGKADKGRLGKKRNNHNEWAICKAIIDNEGRIAQRSLQTQRRGTVETSPPMRGIR